MDDLWADSACRSAERLEWLGRNGYREHVQRNGRPDRPLSSWEQQGKRHSRIRSRVEHIFGIQAQHASSLIGGSTGLVRARTEIGLRNLPCNLDRYCTLVGPGGIAPEG